MAIGGEVRGALGMSQRELHCCGLAGQASCESAVHTLTSGGDTACPAQREGWQLSGTQLPYCHSGLYKIYAWGGFR